jgi:nitrate reductase gamma subunit/ferredoxin
MRIDTGVLSEMKNYGAFDIDACFNCGNCTAVCPLSKENVAFPRRVIRYAQLGQTAHLAASPEVWLCYYCAECSETCPREAEPGAFMAAARRYATAAFDPTGFSRLLYRSTAFALAALAAVFAVLVLFLLGESAGPVDGRVTTAALLEVVPYEVIHWVGIGVIALMSLAALVTLVNLFWMIAKAPVPGAQPAPSRPGRFPLRAALGALAATLGEVLGHGRYRECSVDSPRPQEPLLLRRWLVHFSIMVGMIGLAAATALDWLFKTPGSYVPIWYPIRLLGTIAGVLLVYGTAVAIVQRLRRADKYHARSLLSDWLFLGFLWVIGVSGFVLELGEYVTLSGLWIQIVFVVHVALAMELILLLPFTKFAHIVYRPAAIWFNEFRGRRSVAP